MELRIEPQSVDKKTVVLKLTGEMDIYTAPRLKEQASTLIREGRSQIILEMAGLDYIDSTGIGVLVGSLTRAKENGGCVCLVSPTRPVSRLLEIVGISKIMATYPSLEQALHALPKG